MIKGNFIIMKKKHWKVFQDLGKPPLQLHCVKEETFRTDDRIVEIGYFLALLE